MAKDMFRERGRGEEEAYFRRQDAELIAKLRQNAQFSEIAHALAEKLHADEPALLERIKKLGVTLDTGAAFILAPLVEVAWADGDVSHAERDRHSSHREATRRGAGVRRSSSASRLAGPPPAGRHFTDGAGSDPHRHLRPSARRIGTTGLGHDQGV